MTLKEGDVIRILRSTHGFRESSMYVAVHVDAGVYAQVSPFKDGWRGRPWIKAAVLRFLKGKKQWVPTKLEVRIINGEDNYHGEGSMWERVDVLDRLVMLSGVIDGSA